MGRTTSLHSPWPFGRLEDRPKASQLIGKVAEIALALLLVGESQDNHWQVGYAAITPAREVLPIGLRYRRSGLKENQSYRGLDVTDTGLVHSPKLIDSRRLANGHVLDLAWFIDPVSKQRVNVGECTAWVQTNLEFDVQVHHPDQTTETKPFIIDTFCQHHGAVEPILYLSPSGKWVRRVSFAEFSGLKPKPPLFIEITQPLATKWLWANGYPVPAGGRRSRPMAHPQSARPLAGATVRSPTLA